jgi:IclR family transcriptional regulator, acetate operon repressor
VKNKPAYAIASVDSALLLASLLQQEGAMRVTDVAERLGVSVSTAHRLLGMLVYRDFAEQLPDRRYVAGPVLRQGPVQQASVARLREVALPHLRRVVEAVGETANLVVLAGRDVRFVATAESDQVLRVGDRAGRTLPAHLSSGGKAVLATLDDEAVATALDGLDDATSGRVVRELRTVRRRGFAVNDQDTEAGLTAVGVAVPAAGAFSGAALSVAAPTVRYSRDRAPVWAAALNRAANAIARDLDAG